MTDPKNFRDLTGLSRLLKGSLLLYAAIAAAGLWSSWLDIALLQRAQSGAPITDAQSDASDGRQMIVSGLYFLSFLVTGFLFLRWTYLSNRNARILGAAGMRFTPAWAIGWYFVPVAMLWKPYQALKEIFKASHPDYAQDWHRAPRPGILPLWWALWILSIFVDQASLRAALRADTIDELLVSSWLEFISCALDLPLGIVVIFLVARLQEWQRAKQRQVASVAS